MITGLVFNEQGVAVLSVGYQVNRSKQTRASLFALLGVSSIVALLPLMAVAKVDGVKLFKTKPGPPPGFEAAVMHSSQTNMLDVIFNGHKVAEVLADFNAKSVRFHEPAFVLANIKNLIDRDLLAEALSAKLPANENHLCSYSSPRPYCLALNPKRIGVILDQRRYRVYLFINPRYFKASQQTTEKQIEPSTSSQSLLLQNSLVASGTRDAKAYAWINKTIWANGNNRASVDVSIQENNNINNGAGFSQMNIQRAYFGRVQKDILYRAGQLSTIGGNDFITQQYFLGASARNFNTGLPDRNHFGTPVPLYITTPSTVKVYRNGILIASQQFNAGQHFLDTSNYPSGAYDVSIQVTQNVTNQTNTITRYFVKQTALPPRDKLNFSVAGGLLQRNLSFNQNKFLNVPIYQNKPILFWRSTDALHYNLGWETTALLNDNRAYLSQHFAYYGRYGNLTPGALFATRGIYGLSMNASTHFSRVTTGASAMKIWGRERADLVGFNNNEVLSSSNQPLSFNDLRANVYVSLNIGKSNLYASSTWTQSGNSKIEKEYALSLNQTLFSGQNNAVDTSLSITRSSTDTLFLASVNYEFNTASGLNAHLRGGYSAISNRQAKSSHGNGLFDATVSKHTRFGYNRTLDVTLGAHRDTTERNANVQATYMNNWFRANASIMRSFAGSDNNTSYSGELDSNIVYAGNHFSMGYSQGYQSGIVLDVMAPDTSRVKVLVDGSPVAIVKTNTPTSLYLEPYLRHEISVVPLGEQLYQYNKSPVGVMLYDGNMQFLPWALKKQFVLFTQVLDESGKPLKDALLKAKGAYNATDQMGYIQINATTQTKKLTFEQLGGGVCTVKIPGDLEIKNNYTYLKSATCNNIS